MSTTSDESAHRTAMPFLGVDPESLSLRHRIPRLPALAVRTQELPQLALDVGQGLGAGGYPKIGVAVLEQNIVHVMLAAKDRCHAEPALLDLRYVETKVRRGVGLHVEVDDQATEA